ncbi:cytochrome c [Catalinimonas sp. 4WD22]|uniref:c-type cytochrome n=1 Tax=Catalinimonas locisalis TaxID=3133978 RepID=UPI0031011295
MYKKALTLILTSFFVLILAACTNQNESAAISELSTTEKMHFKQYIVYGQQLYKQHCSNCHQDDGSGLGRLIPPLAKADYMLEDVNRTVCTIKYGLAGEIIVNGESYNQKMPANKQLTDLEIAQITTYILNSWGNEKGYISVKEASGYLKTCE